MLPCIIKTTGNHFLTKKFTGITKKQLHKIAGIPFPVCLMRNSGCSFLNNFNYSKFFTMRTKKTFCALAAIAAITFNLQTANAQATWRLPGNANATVNSILGTTNAIPLRLTTNNTTRMYINATTGNVGIGTGNTSDASYRLQVTGAAYGIYGSGTSYGMVGTGNTGVYGSGTTYGVYGYSGSNYGVYGSSGNIGVYGSGTANGVYGYSATNYGVRGNSGFLGVYGTGTTYGVYGDGYYGVYGYSSSNYGVYGSSGYMGVYGSGTSYGVYGYAAAGRGVQGYSTDSYGGYFSSVNSYGIRAATTSGFYAGVFDGNVYAFGAYYSSSDKNLKKNIQDVGNAMNIINKLKPKHYEFSTDEKFKSLNLPKGTHYGLIAQELEEVLPNLVKETAQELSITASEAIKPKSTDGKEPTLAGEQETAKMTTGKKEIMKIKGVNYDELIPILIKGMQEQDAKIESLMQLVNKLQGQPVSAGSGEAAKNASISSITLDQNVPNPLTNSTSIRYNIPEGASKAQLIITDNNGNTVKQIQLSSKGYGTVNVETSRLSSGTYAYALVVDGKMIDSKKMVIAR